MLTSHNARVPRLNDPVHYVAYGTPGGEYQSVCRAAHITAVPEIHYGTVAELVEKVADIKVDLFVMNPTGTFHNQGCPHSEAEHRGGTWHYGDDCAS